MSQWVNPVLIKGFCDGFGVPGVPQNPPISDRIKGFCMRVRTAESTSFGPDKGVLRRFWAWGVPQNPPVSDRLKGFCMRVRAAESTSFGPDKGVLRWFWSAWCAPKPTNFGPDKGVLHVGAHRRIHQFRSS